MYSIKAGPYTLVFSSAEHFKQAKSSSFLPHKIRLADVVHHKIRGFVKVRNTDLNALNMALLDKEVTPPSPKEELLEKIREQLANPIMFTDETELPNKLLKVLEEYEITPKVIGEFST